MGDSLRNICKNFRLAREIRDDVIALSSREIN